MRGDVKDAYRADFDDSSWDVVSLPHGIEYLPTEASGCINYQGIVWYRKHFAPDAAWKGKKLAVYVVGASPVEGPDVEECMKNLLNDEQRGYISAFYCQGGLDYDKMNKPSKMAMKMLISILNKKKDPTEKDKAMVEMISHSYDISDEKFIEPIVEYVMG